MAVLFLEHTNINMSIQILTPDKQIFLARQAKKYSEKKLDSLELKENKFVTGILIEKGFLQFKDDSENELGLTEKSKEILNPTPTE